MRSLPSGVAIITGGGGAGSGRAIARRLARAGLSVVVADVDEAESIQTVDIIAAERGTATVFRADVTSESDVNNLIDSTVSRYGRLDVIVNDASHDPGGLATFEQWLNILAVDLHGTMNTTRLGIAAMRRTGGGAIVNIASETALGHGRDHSPWPAYDVAKAGVIRLTTTLGSLAAENIRVNCVVPGWIASPPVQSYVDSLLLEQRRDRGVPERLLSTAEIAGAVYALVSHHNLAGRVLLLPNDKPPALIAENDVGYSKLEPVTFTLM